MEDLAQVTVYALYLWIAASLLWMWRSVLRNRRARKLAADQGRSEGRSDETASDQDEMMSSTSRSSATSTASTASTNSTSDSNLDLRSDAVSNDGAVATGDAVATGGSTTSHVASNHSNHSTTQGSLEKADTEPAMAPAANQPNNNVPTGSLPAKSEATAKSTEKHPKGRSNEGRPVQQESNQPATIAGHLSGIRLPYDLLPMVPNGEKASDQRVSLVSDGAQPEVVGAAIADELERLGYAIKTLAADEAVAVRDKQTLGLLIHPDASKLSNEAGSRFPEAVDGSVAIDLWVKE